MSRAQNGKRLKPWRPGYLLCLGESINSFAPASLLELKELEYSLSGQERLQGNMRKFREIVKIVDEAIGYMIHDSKS